MTDFEDFDSLHERLADLKYIGDVVCIDWEFVAWRLYEVLRDAGKRHEDISDDKLCEAMNEVEEMLINVFNELVEKTKVELLKNLK